MTRTFRMKAHRTGRLEGIERELNEQQRAVVEAAGGPMLVIAGAGSGKTRTLTWRLARLLADGVDPGSILLMTFTNRAAREMLHRVELLVPHDARRVWGGTFHHVGNRILRTHGARLGIAPEFTILDREDSGDLLAHCVVEEKVRIAKRRFPGKAVLMAMASGVASTLQPLEAILHDRFPSFVGLHPAIASVLVRYERHKLERQMLDYDDLLAQWLRLLETQDDLRDELAERFHHLLVDEYQDTNAIQGRIVDILAEKHRNVCVVGDDSQSIYSFRGASFANILGFRTRYPDAVEYRLELNYRSTPEILALANASIEHNTNRLPKRLRAARPSGLRPALVPCGDHFVQSRFIGEYILHLLDEGRGLMDIAVLYRSHWHAMEIQLELQRRDIPFSVRGGLRFFEQAHIKDVLAVLRIRHNPRDELAWQRVLRLMPRIGGTLAHRIYEDVVVSRDPLAATRRVGVDLPGGARASLDRLGMVLDRVGRIAAPGEMIEAVVDGFYGDHLESRYENAELRRQDIQGVADFAGQYRSVEAFLTDVALTGDFTGETCEDGPSEQLFVTLSTVHQAKGLEWPVVLVPWMSDGRFPTDMAMKTPADLEEERRVFHVATTRARDELYLIVPQVWSNRRQERILMKPSRFLTELGPNELFETMRIEDDLPVVTAGP